MRLTPEQRRVVSGLKRAATRNTRKLWPKGVLYYVIDGTLGKLLSIIAVKNQRDIPRNKAI